MTYASLLADKRLVVHGGGVEVAGTDSSDVGGGGVSEARPQQRPSFLRELRGIIRWRAFYTWLQLRRVIREQIEYRQMCSRCGRCDGYDFHTTDAIWETVYEATRYGVLCLACFTEEAERLGLPWRDHTWLCLGRAEWFALTRVDERVIVADRGADWWEQHMVPAVTPLRVAEIRGRAEG